METIRISLAIGLAFWLVGISVIDIRTQRIPDLLSLPLVAGGLLVAVWRSSLPFHAHLIGLAAGYLVLAGIGHAYFLRRGEEGLGLGDAKLFGAAGAWLGWAQLPFVLLAASCLGLFFAILARKAMRARIAFGPFLAAGFWLTWVLRSHELVRV